MGRQPRGAAAREKRRDAASVRRWIGSLGRNAARLARAEDVASTIAREAAEFLGIAEAAETTTAAETAELIGERWDDVVVGQETGEAELMANVAIFSDLLRLTEIERDVLALFAAIATNPTLQTLLERIDVRSRHQAVRVLSVVLDRDVDSIREALRSESALARFGVLNIAGGGAYDFSQFGLLNEDLERALSSSQPNEDELLNGFFEVAAAGTLARSDFAHLEPQLTTLIELLRGAGMTGTKGVNVLFYGVVGTGKTELARVIGDALNWRAYEVKTTNRNGTASTPDERMGSYALAQQFLQSKAGRLVIFDELEDVLGEGGSFSRPRFGKLYFNRLLETNPVPTIWIANDIEALGYAARRRFDFSIAFGPLPGVARRRVLDRHLKGFHGSLRAQLARRETLLPAQVATGRKVAELAPSQDGALLQAVDASMKLLGQPIVRDEEVVAFDVSLCNADVDLTAAAAAFKTARARGTLCLYGPPGAGKSALAGYFADTIGRRAVRFAASDLLSAFLGESEQRVARAFEGIDIASEILVLEEADELLAARMAHRQSWEIRIVNEMLERMDAYGGIAILTTNALDRLDTAVLRRCELKVRLDYLQRSQKERMWKRVTGKEAQAAALQKLAALDRLTAGDFVAVLGQAKLVGAKWGAADWIAALEKEQSIKPVARSMGFVV